MIADIPVFIRENTRVLAPSHVPELELYLADDAVALWELTEEQLGELGLPPPFWAFAWAGGQALARYVLDHPEVVAGKRVLDVASGSGLVAIAAMKAGAILVALNPKLSVSEVAYIVSDARPSAVVFEQSTRGAVARAGLGSGVLRVCVDGAKESNEFSFETLASGNPGRLPDIAPEFDDCLISYTSGTTGKPKGAVLTQANYIFSNGYINAQQMGIGAHDRILTTTPLAHRTGFSRVINMLCLGSTLVVMERFDARQAVRLIEAEGVTVLGIVPTVGRMLLPEIEADPARFRSVRIAVVAGEAFPVELKVRLQKALPGLSLYAFFGMTELGALTLLGPQEQVTKAASVGRVNPGAEVRIVDDAGNDVPQGEAGEILVRSGAPGRFLTMRCYFNNPQATAETLVNGWLRTGDMGRFDADGYLYIVDRKKDMVKTSGFQVWPREIEEVLSAHPAVMEVGVAGIPDAVKGEVTKAWVVLKSGASATEDQLRAYCRERLAPYKVPARVEFRTELPKTMVGKVLRRALAAER